MLVRQKIRQMQAQAKGENRKETPKEESEGWKARKPAALLK